MSETDNTHYNPLSSPKSLDTMGNSQSSYSNNQSGGYGSRGGGGNSRLRPPSSLWVTLALLSPIVLAILLVFVCAPIFNPRIRGFVMFLYSTAEGQSGGTYAVESCGEGDGAYP